VTNKKATPVFNGIGSQLNEDSLFVGQAHFIGCIRRNDTLFDYYELDYDGNTSFVYVPRNSEEDIDDGSDQ